MTHLSTVTLIDLEPTVSSPDNEVGDVVKVHGCPSIKGNYLVNGDKISLINRNSETLIMATPLWLNGKVVVHLAIGSETRRICHNMSVEGFALIVQNMRTMLQLAELEANQGDPECPSRKNK